MAMSSPEATVGNAVPGVPSENLTSMGKFSAPVPSSLWGSGFEGTMLAHRTRWNAGDGVPYA